MGIQERIVADIKKTVVKVIDNVPVYIKDIGYVSLGPALGRGALDKGGAEEQTIETDPFGIYPALSSQGGAYPLLFTKALTPS